MKYVLVPDSFKGTMSSKEICSIMQEQIYKHEPNATVVAIPVADGGEGTVDCFLDSIGGDKIELNACGPFLEERIDTYYGIVDNGQTAIIEMSACAGLPRVENRANPMNTTTFGVGECILHAAKRGVKKIIIGLGGSATNDAGCGAAAAIGVKFYDADNKIFIPTGGTLSLIDHIDLSQKSTYLDGIEMVAMCDIDNPVYGKNGAAYIFAPQKGADQNMIKLLDDGLIHFSDVLKRKLNIDIAKVRGGGAAGAMGAGMIAFFDARLQMGIDTVLDVVNFERLSENADLILTGEGKIDTQSLQGKAVIGVARRAKKMNIPVIAVVGDIGDNIDKVYMEGVNGIISINRIATDFQTAKTRARSDMALTIDNLLHMIDVFKK